jgi:hypothetical protein
MTAVDWRLRTMYASASSEGRKPATRQDAFWPKSPGSSRILRI